MALVLTALTMVTNTSMFYCFAAADYVVEVISVENGRIIGGTWRPAYYFFHTEEMSVKVTVKNNDASARTATIYVNAFDDLSHPFKLYVTNITLSAEETRILYAPIYVPKWAVSGGNGHIEVTAKTWPERIFCPEKADDFYLLPGIPSYLTVGTFSVNNDMQLYGLSIWVDGDFYLSPVTVPLATGSHDLKVESRYGGFENGVYYTYKFSRWDDGSILNSRTISVSQAVNSTVTAYYHDGFRSLR